MKRIPMGVSNYEELIDDNYYYVDKTKYIEKLENFSNKRVMFLRPRKFGKTLFTSVLENYYDILKANKFEKLFKETYIGKNPSKLKNSYHILKFNFSGIDTSTEETTMLRFKEKVENSIESFVKRYQIDFIVNTYQTAEGMLNSLFTAFRLQKQEEKIYVIIDEYDHFANEILTFNKTNFKEMVARNGKIRKWYEVLKEGTETVVDRIFITGVAPITLDSLTSGFNIATDITRDIDFNDMVGFSKEELIDMMNEQRLSNEEQEKLLPIMKENYDGYRFAQGAKVQMYNSNMSLNFLSNYVRLKRVPEQLIDVNIASDYGKLAKMLDLCEEIEKKDILEKSMVGETIVSEIVNKFNPETNFGTEELISMLFYLGYLTITKDDFGIPELKIPNKIMRELYSEYFLASVQKEENFRVDMLKYNTMTKELATEGKIDKIIEMLREYLQNLSNRDYQRFDEKYVKILFYSIAMNLKTIYNVKSEAEVNREYPDLLIVPRDREKTYYSAIIEFKYIKKEDYTEDLLKNKQKEAKEQIQKYAGYEEIRDIKNLKKYTVIAVLDKIYVESL